MVARRAALEEEIALLEEKATRRAPERLSVFVRLLWPVVEPAPLKWGRHMQAVCDVLQAVAEERIRRLVINVPPGFSKSLLVSVFYPAWRWLRCPERRLYFLSHDIDLARRDSRRTRILITSPEYRALVERQPKPWTLAKDQNELLNFENSAKGFRYCGPVGAGITGKRGDEIWIDDAHDVKEAIEGAPERIAERMAEVSTVFDQAIATRLNDATTGVFGLIGQRLHEGDLPGHCLKQPATLPDGTANPDYYERLILPMRFDPDRADPRDWRREAGELLDPVRFPEPVVAALERKLGTQASGQLQQAPVNPGGGMFPVKDWWWLARSEYPKFTREAAGFDLAFGANKAGAFSVGLFAGLCQGRAYLTGAIRGRFSVPELMVEMDDARRRHPRAVGWYLEDRAAARPTVETLRVGLTIGGRAIAPFSNLVLCQPDGDKVARAQAWQPCQAAGSIVLPCNCGMKGLHRHTDENALPGEEWAVAFVRECAQFPRGVLKDQVDAAGYLFTELLLHKPFQYGTPALGPVGASTWAE